MARHTKNSDLAIAATLAAGLIIILALKVDRITTDHPQFAADGDHLAYYAMASRRPESVEAPFCYRILIPGLVRVLPISRESGFYLQTLFFLWSSGIVLFLVHRELGETRFFA